ncbi:hypothetical protein [Methylocystis parvus]|uniref:Uncharacterized protein n=1 Tax=Methylocystis parvus TaxID=134 RepID=A0A6B8MB70_9HYPH|nr:hypothetical protein [Methylocystis parvus]QGM98849.1 hypothetical protein F7D14_16080 [Methylocystis parvus]WBK00798.1 hypothetical protein MMG94_03465 [Methylocystis parvus OBBP]
MSETRDIRLIAQWRDDPTEALMTVDLRIEGARLASTWDVFGAFDLDGAHPRPFILRRDGRLDFGEGADHWRTDLRDAEMRVTAYFTVWFNETDSGQYKIVKIAELGAKERK